MKVFSICGYSDSGKTTTAERLIRELEARGYKVGSIKEIHYEGFALDNDPAGDTSRHRMAGASLVTARGLYETDVLFPGKLDAMKILSFYGGFDYVLCESVRELPVPMIVTAASMEDLDKNWNDFVFCVSGKIADEIGEHKGIPAISALADAVALADMVESTVYDMLPNVAPVACGLCGSDCRCMGIKMLRGEASREDCVAGSGPEVYIGDTRIALVPFVQKALNGVVTGFVKELKGYQESAEIVIKIKQQNHD